MFGTGGHPAGWQDKQQLPGFHRGGPSRSGRGQNGGEARGRGRGRVGAKGRPIAPARSSLAPSSSWVLASIAYRVGLSICEFRLVVVLSGSYHRVSSTDYNLYMLLTSKAT